MGGGFCTFNGLVVVAMKLKALGLVKQVGILDLDMHYGDGTAELIRHHGLTWIRHHSQGSLFHDRRDAGKGEQLYRDWLDTALSDLQNVDLVLYQASADSHINDPLGGLLSEQAMCQRDKAVFRALWGRPLVWNLAGGYQVDFRGRIDPVLRLHRNTLLAALAVAQLYVGEDHHD